MTKMKNSTFQTLGKKAILFFAFLFGALFSFAQNPITTQPTDEVGCTQSGGGFIATYSIATSISGATSIVYAWQADTGAGWAAVPAASPFGGVNGPVMTIANPSGCKGDYTQDSTKFRCAVIVSGGPNAGVWYSDDALLVLFAPVTSSDFTTKYGTYASLPDNDTVCEGGSTYYVVDNLATTDTCVGIKVVDYRWQKKPFGGSWANISLTNPTADTDSLVLSNIPLTDDVSQYRCVITSDGCTDLFYTDTVILMVDPKPEADFSDSDNTLYVCEGDSFTVNIDISNSALSANRAGTATDWEIYFDTTQMGGFSIGFTDGDGDLDSLDGTGNGTPAITFGHGGIAAYGTYILKIDSIINSSSSLRCPNVVNQFLTIHVYPRPVATIVSASPRDICEGDTVCFDVVVTNAVFNGAGMDWGLHVIDPKGSTDASSGYISGNGNSTITYCTNPGLLTDSFRIQLDSIFNVDSTLVAEHDSCKGTIAPQDSLDIRIVPTPNAVLGSTSGALSTSFAGVSGWSGNMFDLSSTDAITVDSLTCNLAAGTWTVEVYYKTGTHVGSETTSGAWTLAGSQSVTSTGPGGTKVAVGFDMAAATTYGVYVTTTSAGIGGLNGPMIYSSGSTPATDGTLSFTPGNGIEYPFTTPTFSGRTWNGTVHYSGGLVTHGDTVRVCLNDSIPFDFRVFNTVYEGVESNWELTLTDPSGSVTHSSTLVGSATGDTVYTDTIWTAGMTPGTYTYALTSVKLTTTTNIPDLGCEKILNQSFVFEVYPRPDVQFSHDTFNLCKNSSDVFDIEVTNSLFDGNPVPWKLYFTDTSSLGILPASADTGTGNITPSYQFPNNIPVGTYMITLDSIHTDWNQNGVKDGNDCWGGSTCYGMDPCEIADTIIINVLPTPIIDLVAYNLDGTGDSAQNDTLRHCENDSVEFVITIDSAVWKGIDLAWTVHIVDATGVFSSPMTGYGDTVIRDTTSMWLADGRYTISIASVQIDTLGQTCSRTITDETVTLEIYSNPVVTFAQDSVTVCEGETDNWDIQVSDAMFEGDGQAWSVYFTDTSGLIWPGTSPYQDTGNLTPTFAIPTNLPVGRYEVIIDSIAKDNTPRCIGSVTPIGSMIINVYPKMEVTMTPNDTVEVCEGVDTTFTITVYNSSYHRTVLPDSANWSLDFTDETGSTLGASPLVGYGDTVATYTISNTLTPGYYSIILTNVTTDSGCVRAINDTLTIFVKRLPSLTILDVIEPICDGDSLRVDFRVDSGFLGHNWTFDYTLVPNYSSNLPGTVSDTFDASGSFVGQFTVADTITRGPFSRLLDFGPVTNLTTGCTEIDSVPDSTFYVHPLPTATITGTPTVCSGQFDPLTNTPVTGWEDSTAFDAVISGTTVGSLDKDWTLYWHVNGPNGYVSTGHTTTGTGDNAGIPYDVYVPDSLYYHFDSAGAGATFELVLDSIKISGTFANCENLDPQDSTDFTVNPNPLINFDVPDSLCLGTIFSFDRTVMGVAGSDDWRFTYSWDLTAYDGTPYFGPFNVDGTDTGTANVVSNYPIAAGMYYIWTDTLWNKTTNCYAKPEILDSFRMDPPTDPDTLYGDVTVCEDTNSGFMWLEGHVGQVLRWEVSHFGSSSWGTWETVAAAGNAPENRPVVFSAAMDTMWYTNKTYSTRYRALVKSGACDSAYSNIVQIFVNPQPAATMLTLTDNMCLGDTADGTFSVTSVPTSNFWTVYWSSTNPTLSGSFTGKGSGVFPFEITGLTGLNSVVTLDSIVNTNTGCINTELNTNTQTVVVNGLASAGTLSESLVVCVDENEGTLELNGFTGSVTKWQSSVNGGSTWVDINTTDSTYTFKDLTDTTMYRVIVNSGSCSWDTSNVVTISTLELPNATISGSDTICPGTTLGLSVTVTNTYGKSWTITYLEGSLTYTMTGTGDGTFTLTTGSIYSTTDVTLQSIGTTGAGTTCFNDQLDNPGTATVTIVDQATATLTSAPDSICNGSSATVNLNVSNVLSTDSVQVDYSVNGVAQTPLMFYGPGSHSFTISSTVLVATSAPSTNYWVRLDTVTNTTSTAVCAGLVADSLLIRVDTATVGGTTSGAQTVCYNNNTGTVTLTGNIGDVIRWESSNDSASWVQVNNYTTTLNYANLTDTTWYRAVSKNGACGIAYSTATRITVRELPLATIVGGDTICSGLTDDLTISITNVGSGVTWYIALLEGTRTDTISGTGTSYTYTTGALTTTTDVTLQSIWTGTQSSPDCYNSLNNVATSTVTVLERPYATINTGPGTLCHGDAFTFTVDVSNVATGIGWTLYYSQDGATGSLTGTGSGTFVAPSLTSVTATEDTVTLTLIEAYTGTHTCDSTLSEQGFIAVDPTTIAGTIGANDTVCIGGSGVMSQTAAGTGSIIKWQSKVGSAGTWVDINNTTNSNPYYNLLNETYFRAVYQSGVCPSANSNEVVAVPKDLPMATMANATGDDTVCAGETADFVLTVTNVDVGHTFTVDYLEGSTLKSTPTMTQNATGLHTITTSALTTTTTIQLRKIEAQRASSLTCEQNLSGTITVEVEENPNATLTSVPSVLCHGDDLTFTFAVSDVATGDAWTLIYGQDGVNFSTTGTGPGTFTITTTKTVTATAESIALVSVTNNSTADACITSLSESQSITIDTTTVPGVIAADQTVCIGGDGTISQTTAGVGSIVKWQFRIKGASSWTDIAHVFTSYQYYNLQDTTEFRAVYKNNTCSEAASNIVTATPKPLPVATIATQAATDTICAGTKATLSVTVTNVDAGDSVVITYLEGSVSKSIGYRLTTTPQTFDLETGALAITSDIVLQTIQNVDPAAGQPMCSNTMNNTAKATITVIELPFATITSAPDTICQGDYIPFTVNISNVSTTDMWALSYQLEGDIDTIFGTGPGSFTHVDTDPNTASSALIALDTIYNLSNIGICKSAKTDDWALHIWEPTVAGMIEAHDTICKGGDSKVNEISGTVKTGNIIGWEYRPISTNAWTEIPNASTTLDVLNLLETTTYRAVYKNGTCDTMHSNYITIDVRELPVATISGSATVCEGDSTDLTVTITNVGSLQDWEVDYLEGVTTYMMTGTGNGTFTLRVGNFNTTTDITLQEIRTVSLTPQCTNDKLVNNATATVAVNQRPYASLNSTVSPVCQGSASSFDITVANVRSGENWTVTYNVVDTLSGATYSGTGPGTFTVTTPGLNDAKTYTVELTHIENTTTTCDSTLSSSMAIVVDATTDPGTVAADTTVCYAANAGTVTQTGGNGTIIRWEYSEDAGATWTTINSTSSTNAYSNLTKTTMFRAVKQNGVCDEATQATPVTVTVRELPVASISGSDTICANTTGSVTVSVVNSYGEDWSVEYLVGTVIDTLNVSGPLTSGTITTPVLNSNTDITLRKVWLTSGIAQCENDNLGTNAKATIEVNPLPIVTLIQLEDSVCFGSSASGKVSVNNVRSTESWKVYWSINGGLPDSVSGIGAGSFNFTTVALTANPSVVRLVRINNMTTGCAFLPTDEDTVIVSPTTAGGTLTGVDTVCKGANTGVLTLGADAIGDVVKWEYSEDNGTTWTDINSNATTHTYTNLTTTTLFRVLVKSGVCSSEYSTTVEVVVNELPMVEITGVGENSICEGSSTYILISVSNVSSAQSWEISYTEGSATMTKTGTGPGTDTIWTSNLSVTTDYTLKTIKITSGAPTCENINLNTRHTTTIKVVDNPLATITNYPSDVCKGTNPEVTVLVSKVKSTESWTVVYKVNNGSSKSTTGIGSGQFTFNIGALNTEGPNGVRLVSITNTGSSPNCTSALTDSVTINVDSTSVAGTVSGTSVTCKGSGGTLTVTGNVGSVVKWQYSTDGITYFDIANTSTTYTFASISAKTWFRVVVKSGVCPEAVSTPYVVDIQELPTVSIANPTQTICDGSSTTLSLVIGNLTSTDTWTVTYKENGTTKTVNGTGTSGTISLGPLSSTTDVNIIGIAQTNGLMCANTLNEKATITVLENPTATINIVPDSLCEGDILTFSVVVDDVTSTTGWELDYTIDGVAAATVTGTGSGTFTINSARAVSPTKAVIRLTNIALTSTPFCSTTLSDSDSLVVSPTTVGGTVTPASSTICEGDNVTLTLSGETGDIQNWEYSTDGGSTWTVLSNTSNVLNANNVLVTTMYRVYVQSGTCAGAYSTTATVTVIPQPDATVSSSDIVCPDELATFTLHVSDVPAGHNWSVVYRRNGAVVGTPVTGTGSGDFDFAVTGSSYNGNPTYITVELVSITNTTHNCVNANLNSSASARVTPNPVAAFIADNACEDSVVVFNNTSSIAEGSIASFKWYFGDGDSSLANSPTHKYAAPGTYTVRLVAVSDNGCTGEVTKTVTVYDDPVADFTTANVCKNADLVLTDASSVANGTITGWFWEFGDGNTSTAQNPSHRYAAAGNYFVTLTVTTNNGCTSSVSKEVTIYVLPEANFVAQPVCENDAMQFINTSAIGYGSMTWEWDFATQGTSTAKDPQFTFAGFGTFEVEMIATSNFGCKDTIKRSVTVHPKPTAGFTVDPVCIGEASEFVNTSSVATGSVVEYFWNFGDTTFSGLKDPSHTYARPNVAGYPVTLRIKTDQGCEDEVTGVAVVQPLPDVQLTATGPTEFCDGDSVNLTANSNARTYDWTFSDGSTTSGVDNIWATKNGWHKVRITAPPIGCANEDSIFITVWPLPDAKAWPRHKVDQSIDTIHRGESLQLHASGGEVYSWDPIDYLDNAGIADPVAERVDAGVTYTVTVTDSNGCVNTATLTIHVLNEFKLVVYNVVTPNADGYNDTWIIDNIWAYPEAEVIIFNRYGMEVYRGTNYANDWDGTYEGKDLPDGAYYYVILHPDFPDIVYKGAINLIRNRK